MWQHELFPEHSIMMFATPESQEKYKEVWRDTLQSIKSVLKQSKFFFFGDFIEQGLMDQRDKRKRDWVRLPKIYFPYKSTVFEYTIKSSYTKGGDFLKSTKRIISLIDDGDRQFFISIAFLNDGYYGIRKNAWFINPFAVTIEKDNNSLAFRSLFREVATAFPEQIRSDLCHNVFFETETALTLLDILNCQNVITKDVLPPEKLNRKRIRKGKLPLYTYKILEVVKGKPKSKNGGSVPWDYKSPASIRFHLCRGHFKTFTPDKPLFGKYSGTFWWNPQSRGNKELGEIEKDYDVKVV